MYAFVYTEKPARVTSPISPPSRKNKIGIITPEGDCPVRLQIGYTNDSVFLMLLFFSLSPCLASCTFFAFFARSLASTPALEVYG